MIFRERHLQIVWGLGLHRMDGLRTEDGRAVRVVDPGIPNPGAGPDFRDARLSIGGRDVRGDVELHLRTDGWAAHRHDESGSYSSVVLHVALERGRRSGPPGLPELILGPALLKSRLELVGELELVNRVSPPSTRPDFERMGEIRFRRKVGRFERLLMTSSPGQVFYRGVMIGLGYRPNQAPFEELSRLVPLVCLRGKNREGIRLLLEKNARHLPWRTAGVRPCNHPLLRIRGVSSWLGSCCPDLLHARHMEDPLGAPFDPAGEGLIGEERGRVLLQNVVLPFTAAHGSPGQAEGALTLFRTLPAGPSHRRVQDALYYFGEDPPRTLRREWGMMEGFERRHG